MLQSMGLQRHDERLKGTELTVCPDGLPLEGAPLPGISKVILSLVK